MNIIVLLLPLLATCYIDIDLTTDSSSSDIVLNMPLMLQSQSYPCSLSLQNKEQFIVKPSSLKHNKKSHKESQKIATLHVSSLEGYTLEGWRRFFAQVLFFVDSKYSHTLRLNLSSIPQTTKAVPLTNGLMTLGPQLASNHIYALIKDQTKDFFQDDIVSFYSVPSGKTIKMQLGGYQEKNARGFKNGVRFYEKNLDVSMDGTQWLLSVDKLIISKEKGKKWDQFMIPKSSMSLKLSLQSTFIVLPEELKENLQTSFETQSITCSFSTTSNQLHCNDISSVDEALTFLSFDLGENVNINVSLYSLRDQYNSKSKVTSFFLKLGKPGEVQLGTPLFLGHYISLNMAKKTLMFSPINRFASQISTTQLLRFLVVFVLFMFAACMCIVLWQQFNNPDRTRRFQLGKDGVRLVAYQRPSQFDGDL